MKKKELKKLAKEVIALEQKCQNGENIAENFSLMEKIMSNLSDKEIFDLIYLIEEKFPLTK